MNKTKLPKTKSPLKDTYSRPPGYSLNEQIGKLQERLFLYILVPALFGLIAIEGWVYSLAEIPPNPIIFTVLFLIVLIYCMIKISQIRGQVRKLVQGREGEREVAEYLDTLARRGCYIFHDVPGPNFNIDHVVISTYGIFIIETKAYSKPIKGEASISFDGHAVTLINKSPDSHPIQQALNNAQWLRNQIRENTGGKLFDVTGIVVFPGWFIPKEHMKHKGIWVMNPNWLESSITQLPQTLTPDDVQTVANAVRPSILVRRGSPQ